MMRWPGKWAWYSAWHTTCPASIHSFTLFTRTTQTTGDFSFSPGQTRPKQAWSTQRVHSLGKCLILSYLQQTLRGPQGRRSLMSLRGVKDDVCFLEQLCALWLAFNRFPDQKALKIICISLPFQLVILKWYTYVHNDIQRPSEGVKTCSYLLKNTWKSSYEN